MAPRIPDNVDTSELARQLHEQGVLLQRLMQNFERMARDGQPGASLDLPRTDRAAHGAYGAVDTLALVSARDTLREQLRSRRAHFEQLSRQIGGAKHTIQSPWTSRAETEQAKLDLEQFERDQEQERSLVRILEARLERAERELADALHNESLPSKLAPPSDSDKRRSS